MWWADRVGEERLRWLDGLAGRQRLAEDDALLVHATPRSDEEVLTPDADDQTVDEILAGVPERLILCGHIHIQYRRTRGTREIVNPGSVGLPFDGDQRAAWAMLEDGALALRRTEYDVEAVVAAVEASDAPLSERITGRLRRARGD